jgi:hypothetical protein
MRVCCVCFVLFGALLENGLHLNQIQNGRRGGGSTKRDGLGTSDGARLKPAVTVPFHFVIKKRTKMRCGCSLDARSLILYCDDVRFKFCKLFF